LDAYVAPQSALTVAAQHETAESEIEALRQKMVNQKLHWVYVDLSNPAVLN
jgi:hypothetical protein